MAIGSSASTNGLKTSPTAGITRPPAVPLVTCDPYFCLWSAGDELFNVVTSHWTGKQQRMTSLVRIDGVTHRLMGIDPIGIPTLRQVSVEVLPTRTLYTFEGAGVRVVMVFMTPLLADDLDVLSRPASYVQWTVASLDGKAHQAEVYFEALAELATNTAEQNVVCAVHRFGPLTAVSAGSADQPVLQTRGDDHRIDWGHLYLTTSHAGAKVSVVGVDAGRNAFAAGKPVTDASTLGGPAHDRALAAVLPLGTVGGSSAGVVSGHVTLAYDDEWSIRYFRQNLRPYWRRNGADAAQLLTDPESDFAALLKRCEAFDAELMEDLRAIGGESYAAIGGLSWRQAIAAQKLCADANGQPLMFSKENYSNGCIATVDVLYPAAPQMLIFAPTLLKASLLPLLQYSASDLWKFDSAPHDLGQYPHAVGQIYGGEMESPMPVEESGNMLILLAALAQVEGSAEFSKPHWKTLTLWKDYLVNHGLDPENQLCTDDFAGHIARNVNLSVKAIMGIASYARLAEMLGMKSAAEETMKVAREYVQKWVAMAKDGDHYKLVFGDAGAGTWSQKYNLVWDKLLGFDLFPAEVAQAETAYYKTKMNRYGLPLDSRKTYTKLDWEIWTATLAEDNGDFRRITDACARWANETVSRVPLSDWYETDSSRQCGFQARSVVGGNFIGLMRDPAVWKKYASRDRGGKGVWAELPLGNPRTRTLLPVTTTDPMHIIVAHGDHGPAAGWSGNHFVASGWTAADDEHDLSSAPALGKPRTDHEWDREPHVYARRVFTLPAGTPVKQPHLMLQPEEHDVEVHMNGLFVTHARGKLVAPQWIALPPAVARTLSDAKPNVLGLKYRRPKSGNVMRVGVVDVES